MFDTGGAQPDMASGMSNNNRAAALKATIVAGQWQRGTSRVRGRNGKPVIGAFMPLAMVYLLSVFLHSFSMCEKQHPTFYSSVSRPNSWRKKCSTSARGSLMRRWRLPSPNGSSNRAAANTL